MNKQELKKWIGEHETGGDLVQGIGSGLILLEDLRELKKTHPIVPRNPTTNQKAECMGEFRIETEHSCSACEYDEPQGDCEVCGGDITYNESHQIPWGTCKDVYAAMIKASEE